MFRRILTYLLLITLVFQCLGSLGVLTWFQVNRSYIANVLCENKDKPAMHCNGQCVLMKKLKKLDESDKNSRQANVSKTDIVMVVPDIISLRELEVTALSVTLPLYRSLYTYLYIHNLFLPPQ